MQTLLNSLKSLSHCKRRQVVAVIVDDTTFDEPQVVSIGFNGQKAHNWCMREFYKLQSGEEPDICVCLHAEQMAIQNYLNYYSETHSFPENHALKMYVTHKPCSSCATILARHGFKHITYYEDYPGGSNND